MFQNMIVEIVLILLLILANGVLAMAEIAVISARKVRLQQKAQEGDASAQIALELAEEPNDFLSTVQIGITLVGIMAGAFGGATVAREIGMAISGVPGFEPYADAIGIGLVVVVITYLTLILGELVPKRVALNNAERTAMLVAKPMKTLSRIAAPLVSLLSASTELVLRLLGSHRENQVPITEEEIKVLMRQGTLAGVFEESEQEMVSSVFRLGDRRVDSIITPRTEIYWINTEDPDEDIRRRLQESNFSRLPVARGNMDNILGIVQAKALLGRCVAGEPLDLEASLIPAQWVPESAPALSVLEIFRKSGVHMALIIDEFGGLLGLVTVMDVLEAIVGDIPMLGELEEPEIIRREDGSYLLDGLLPMDEFIEVFKMIQLPEDERGFYQTVGGLVMSNLGRIPQSGDRFEWQGLLFEVMDMDGFRVDKVLVVPPEERS